MKVESSPKSFSRRQIIGTAGAAALGALLGEGGLMTAGAIVGAAGLTLGARLAFARRD